MITEMLIMVMATIILTNHCTGLSSMVMVNITGLYLLVQRDTLDLDHFLMQAPKVLEVHI